MTTIPSSERLAELCSPILLYLSTFRRNAARLVADTAMIREELLRVFHDVERSSRRTSETAMAFGAARYPLVALADEIILNSDWEARGDWAEQLLELHFYSTSAAGDEFYSRLDQVAPEDDQLVEVYFLCLALGFKGRLRSQPEQRRELLQLLHSRLPARVTEKSELLFPDAYEHTIEREMPRIKSLGPVPVYALFAVLIFLAAVAARALTETDLETLNRQAQAVAATESR